MLLQYLGKAGNVDLTTMRLSWGAGGSWGTGSGELERGALPQ